MVHTIYNNNDKINLQNSRKTKRKPKSIDNGSTLGAAATATTKEQHKKEHKLRSTSYFTWLVFTNAKWVPFSFPNQQKLEDTLSLQGTFIDIREPLLLPSSDKMRVFPKSGYLSSVGLKYRISRIVHPGNPYDGYDPSAAVGLYAASPLSFSFPPLTSPDGELWLYFAEQQRRSSWT